MEDIFEKETSTSEVTEEKETITGEPVVESPKEQDPLQEELERVQKKGRTKEEKLLYTRKKIDEQLKELGIEPEKEESHDENDDEILTVGMFKKMQQQNVTKTSLQLADEIESPAEKELVKYHLENTIKSSGDPKEDLRTARMLANASKNKQIIEEVTRKVPAKTFSSGSSAPANDEPEPIELTQEEKSFMAPPFNLTMEQIIAARKK